MAEMFYMFGAGLICIAASLAIFRVYIEEAKREPENILNIDLLLGMMVDLWAMPTSIAGFLFILGVVLLLLGFLILGLTFI